MAITDLSIDLVNVLVENYNLIGKSIIIFMMLFLSAVYLFVIKPNYETQTPFLTKGLFRILLTGFSIGTLLISPIYLFVFNPYFDFYVVIQIIFLFYSPLIIVGGLLIFAEILMFGGPIILKMANVKIEDARINEIYHKIFKKKKGWDDYE